MCVYNIPHKNTEEMSEKSKVGFDALFADLC